MPRSYKARGKIKNDTIHLEGGGKGVGRLVIVRK
jgi:hypothetical protein